MDRRVVWQSRLPLCIASVVLGACGLLPREQVPIECGFPDGTVLAYAGETSLAALGLDSSTSGDRVVGRIFVTRDAIPYAGSLPNTPLGPAVVPDQRQYCAVYRESMSLGGVPDDWLVPPPR